MEIRWMILNGIEWVRSTSNKLEIFGTLCQSHCMVMHKQCGTIPTQIQNMATLFQTSLTIPYRMARLNLSLTGQCISITVMHCCFAATVPTLWNPVHLESPWLHPYTVIKWPYFHLSSPPLDCSDVARPSPPGRPAGGPGGTRPVSSWWAIHVIDSSNCF